MTHKIRYIYIIFSLTILIHVKTTLLQNIFKMQTYLKNSNFIWIEFCYKNTKFGCKLCNLEKFEIDKSDKNITLNKKKRKTKHMH